MNDVPSWHVKGDWFDACKCLIPCSCTFAQPPNTPDETCDGLLIWHIREGQFGDVELDGLSFAAVARFQGNIWDDDTKADMGFFVDASADERQREALQTIFSGQAGGWPAGFAQSLGNMLGMEAAEIKVDIADDLSRWGGEIAGKAKAEVEPLSGPTSVEGKLTAVSDPPGSEVGPGTVATYGTATTDEADAFGLSWQRSGRSSKHMRFEWSGPDE